jgi:hypothetical protein
MRPTLVMTVMVLSVVSVSMAGSSCEAGRREPSKGPERRNRHPEPLPAENLLLEEVQGVGKTRDEAEADALKRACEQVSKILTGQSGETIWKPSPAFLRQAGAIRLLGEPEAVVLPGDGENVRVKLAIELTPEVLGQVRQQIRMQRMGERQRVAARGLGAIMAVLLVVFGYVKFEDLTKGYYTTLLRLMALAALVATGLCLWKLG